MQWLKPVPMIVVFLAIAGWSWPSNTRAAEGPDYVVLAATGIAGVAAGAELEPGQEVQVAKGASVIVLARSGAVLRLTGPCLCRIPGGGLAPAAEAEPKPQARTRRFTVKSDIWTVALPRLREMTDPNLGGNRGAQGEVPDQPDLWVVAVDSSGNRCVRRGDIFLWRRQAEIAAKVDLRSRAARETGLTWPAGQKRMRLPNHVVVDGDPLVLQINDQPRRLVVHILPETIDESEWGEVLIWMAARDCRRQAQFLVDGLNNGTLFPNHDDRPGLSEL